MKRQIRKCRIERVARLGERRVKHVNSYVVCKAVQDLTLNPYNIIPESTNTNRLSHRNWQAALFDRDPLWMSLIYHIFVSDGLSL